MATTTLKLPTTSRSIKGTQAFTNAFALTPSDTVAYNEPIAVYVGKGGTVAGTNGWSVTFASAPEPQSVVTWTDAGETTPVSMGFGNGVQTVFPVTVNGQAYAPDTLLLYKNDWQGNQLQYSTARTNYAYSPPNFLLFNVTTTENAGTAPDGSNTLLEVKAVASQNYCQLTNGGTANYSAAPTLVTESFWVSAGTEDFAALHIVTSDGGASCIVNASTGAIGGYHTYGSPAPTFINAKLLETRGSARLFSMTISDTSGSSTALADMSDGTHPNISFPSGATGTETIYVWGTQLELDSVATSYIPTTTSSVTVTDYTLNSNSVSFTPAAGQLLPQRVKQVMATGTTATDLVGLY